MKDSKKYFDKHGYIFGDSYKCENAGRNIWSHNILKFADYGDFLQWLDTEEYDFREREPITKTEAIKLGYHE